MEKCCFFKGETEYFNGAKWVSIKDYPGFHDYTNKDFVLSVSKEDEFGFKRPTSFGKLESDGEIEDCFMVTGVFNDVLSLPILGTHDDVDKFLSVLKKSIISTKVFDGSFDKLESVLTLFALAMLCDASIYQGRLVLRTSMYEDFVEVLDSCGFPYTVEYDGFNYSYEVTGCHIVNAIIATGKVPLDWYNLSFHCKRVILCLFDRFGVGRLPEDLSCDIVTFLQFVYATSATSRRVNIASKVVNCDMDCITDHDGYCLKVSGAVLLRYKGTIFLYVG